MAKERESNRFIVTSKYQSKDVVNPKKHLEIPEQYKHLTVFKPKQAKDILNISYAYCRKCVASGRIPSRKLNRSVLISYQQLNEFWQSLPERKA